MEKNFNHQKPWPIEKDGKVIGVGIPIINKAIYFDQVRLGLTWHEAKAHAKEVGGELPSKQQLYIIAYFYDELREIWPDIAKDWIWGEEYSGTSAWILYYNGFMNYNDKYYRVYAVPLADLTLNTSELDTDQEYSPEPQEEDVYVSSSGNGEKILKAGLTVLRADDNPSPRIKQLKLASSGNPSWATLEKFETKAARDRRLKELLKAENVITG